ncbi:glycoside hydrolase family 6 protein [Cryptosporangium arvum]|uniref:Glucanase n=1 Tax=Cryptosporangium arvum DSM 44712 TaxID=927661 RepID=A0A010YWR7_9ACTN|nr:glycoside hydrolase family 6 protein [Cryptosporangium arvum]EXG79603.1 cellobiohydrolase A (1,4-beta-cellobiosidase A) [Cryptosporangium arvum DSM 44712]
MRRHRIVLLATAVVVMLGAGVTTLLLRGGSEPERRSISVPKLQGSLYDDGGQAAAWVSANQSDPDATVISEKIASVPQAVWITGGDDAAKAGTQVTRTVAAAKAAGEVPALVAYAIPDRDCGGAAAGGAPDGTAYRAWIDAVATGLGPDPSIVVLEPDALAQVDCLDAAKRSERNELITYAARTITEKAPRAQVYYDAGNSKWKPAAEMAERLRAAGADDYGSGISLNVSNFRPTKDEVGYGKRILDGLGVDGKKIVVDTSRNGAGAATDNEWCDPAGRKLGQTPTLDTGDEDVAAFLWVKRPGEADGCAANAGTFVPDLATALAEGV